MILLKLRASFGKLHGELTLHEGMNLLCLPNESGKSTWSAFLLSMLYGIDTSERATKQNQNLPAKERYRPWDGSAMEGTIELLWQGRQITIERRTQGRVPMGVFRAYETGSGTPIPELTAENCGRVLCGVERSVFERTAFIRQLGLAVTGDAALEQCLGALVTTGEEGKSYSAVEKELRSLKNKYSYRTGLIPRLTAQIEETHQRLTSLRGAQDEAMRLSAECDRCKLQKEELSALKKRIERAQSARKRAGLTDLLQRLQAQETLCDQLEKTCAALPEEARLRELRRKLDDAENELRTAQMEAAFGTAEVVPPLVPPYFKGLSGEQAKEKVCRDAAESARLSAVQMPNRAVPLLVCALLIAAGAALSALSLVPGLIVAGAGAIALISALVLLGRRTKEAEQAQHRAEMILIRYGVERAEELPALAERYCAQLAEFAQKKSVAEAQMQRFSAQLAAVQMRLDAVIAETAKFAPDCHTGVICRDVLTDAMQARERLAAEQRTLETLRRQCDSMQALLGGAEDVPEDAEALCYDPVEINRALEEADGRLLQLSAQLAHKRGQISAQGNAVMLEAELELLAEQLEHAKETNEAITLAMQAMQAADESLRSRFSPQITAEAGQILSELTCGKYPKLLLEPDMRLSVREAEGILMRPAAAMSCGTVDQMYLALRLAMCRRLLPPNAPLLLDDALVNFDAGRADAALALLEKEAKSRQVILFTCRSF